MKFVNTYVWTRVIIITVKTPNTLYVFAIPHSKNTFSKTPAPTGVFFALAIQSSSNTKEKPRQIYLHWA